ncbi:MAG TPA: glycosyltransferase [Candidatus Limnocylindrales bacterium]|nr:glycosyltransferase [Candidatus Limnocylindrales bacterium]
MSRVVMFVFNDCRTDARVLREAGTLLAAGHSVRIIARPTKPNATEGDREIRDGIEIIRVPPPHAWRFYWNWVRHPWDSRKWWKGRTRVALGALPRSIPKLVALVIFGAVTVVWAIVRAPFNARSNKRPAPPGGSALDWLVKWRFSVIGWAKLGAVEAGQADVYHGHDLSGLEAAGRAHMRYGGHLIYDSHEIFLESGSNAWRPRVVKRYIARREQAWMREVAALVTVNESLARELGDRYRPRRTVVVHNCPERWSPPSTPVDLIRDATGIHASAPIALYHGGFSRHRGMEQLAEAILSPGLEEVHAVFLGYGALRDKLVAMTADDRFGGRLHVLDAVPPNELLPWVASADVAVVAIQPSTLNHRLSTPNKLFEALAAGVPVVVSDFPEMRRIVLDGAIGPLGEVCRPDDIADVARAILKIIDRSSEQRAALRQRCLDAAHERWNWETEAKGLLDLYAPMTATR